MDANKSGSPGLVRVSNDDKVFLHITLASLYRDQIKPYYLEVKHRLQELNAAGHVERDFLLMFEALTDYFVVENGERVGIFFKTTPPWFKGWVNPKNPEDPYPAEVWESFESYIDSIVEREVQALAVLNASGQSLPVEGDQFLSLETEFRGGRYGLSRRLREYGATPLRRLSLGQLCHLVQLGIAKGVLLYENSSLQPAAAVALGLGRAARQAARQEEEGSCCPPSVHASTHLQGHPCKADSQHKQEHLARHMQMHAQMHGGECSHQADPVEECGACVASCQECQQECEEACGPAVDCCSGEPAAASPSSLPLCGHQHACGGSEHVHHAHLHDDDESFAFFAADLTPQRRLAELQKRLSCLLSCRLAPLLLSQVRLMLERPSDPADLFAPSHFGYTKLSDVLVDKCATVCRLYRSDGRHVEVHPAGQVLSNPPSGAAGGVGRSLEPVLLSSQKPKKGKPSDE